VKEMHVRERRPRRRAAGELEQHAVGCDDVAESTVARRRRLRGVELLRVSVPL
jgi:hypothetical protein